MTKAYTVVSRDPNSWTRAAQGDCHAITYECGHKHKTIEAALKCQRTLDGTTHSLHANVEDWAQDQHLDGERTEHTDYCAYQAALRNTP